LLSFLTKTFRQNSDFRYRLFDLLIKMIKTLKVDLCKKKLSFEKIITMKTLLFWLPRGFALLFALILMVFSFDVLGMPNTFWEKVGAFLIHTMPSIVMILVVLISWKKPLWGSIFFTIIFIFVTLYFKTYLKVFNFSFMSVPMLSTAIFYAFDYFYGKRDIADE